VIAGYTPSPKSFDAVIIGYYEGPKLMYAARTRNGFTPASRVDGNGASTAGAAEQQRSE
jgi:hypothetical protein